MHKRLDIVTFAWGEWYGRRDEYLIKMKNMLDRNLTVPFTLNCLTDNVRDKVDGIKMKPIQSPLTKGNLRKLSIFNPAYGFGKILAIDLDIVILDNIDEIINFNKSSIMARAAFKTKKKVWKPDGDIHLINMTKGHKARIWNFVRRRGDIINTKTNGAERLFYENFWYTLFPDIRYLQKEFPGRVRSYKQDAINKTCKVPEGTKIVTFHGVPKPHECEEEWICNYWR